MSASLYDILGVDKNADDAQIRRGYRLKCKQHHPDREHGNAEMMLKVREAYDVLSDSERRARYDSTGETKRRTPIDELARQVLLMAFTEFLTKANDHFDPVPGLTGLLNDALTNERDTLPKLDKQLAHINKRAKQLKNKTGEDLFAMLVETQLANTKAAIQTCEARIQAIPRAIEMLKEYEGKPAAEREQYLFGGTTSGTATFSSSRYSY